MLKATLAGLTGLVISMQAAFAQDKATFEQLDRRFTAAFSKGDFEEVAALYTEDAYLLPPDTEIVTGRPKIREYWKSSAEQGKDLSLSTIDAQLLGSDFARTIGTFSYKMKANDQEVKGKYLAVWRKAGSDWKISADIWNVSK